MSTLLDPSVSDETFRLLEMMSLQNVILTLILVALGALAITKLTKKNVNLPPGPPSVPIFGNWLQVGDNLNHVDMAKMANIYGGCFLLRMGQRNVVVISTPEVAEEVLHTQGVEFASRGTTNLVYDIFTENCSDMVHSHYGEHWKKMRRIMTVPFFTNKVLQQSQCAWEQEIGSVIEDVKLNPESLTAGVIIRPRLQLMMYNMLYRMMFNKRFESLEDPLYQKLKKYNSLRSSLTQDFSYNYGVFIPLLSPFLRNYLKTCKEAKEARKALMKSFVVERKNIISKSGTGSLEKAGIDHVLAALENGEINEDNVMMIQENLNIAAVETTLGNLEWVLAEVANYPEVQERVRQELDSVLGRGNLITEQDVSAGRTPYLTAVIKESMRLHMAVPFVVPRMNLKQAKIAEYDIPARTKILINSWWLANNEKDWENPQEFNPKRFLERNIMHTGIDYRFIPFGSGRRICPGITTAFTLLHMVVGRLTQTFVLEPPLGVDKIDLTAQCGQFSNIIKNHYRLVLRPRSD